MLQIRMLLKEPRGNIVKLRHISSGNKNDFQTEKRKL